MKHRSSRGIQETTFQGLSCLGLVVSECTRCGKRGKKMLGFWSSEVETHRVTSLNHSFARVKGVSILFAVKQYYAVKFIAVAPLPTTRNTGKKVSTNARYEKYARYDPCTTLAHRLLRTSAFPFIQSSRHPRKYDRSWLSSNYTQIIVVKNFVKTSIDLNYFQILFLYYHLCRNSPIWSWFWIKRRRWSGPGLGGCISGREGCNNPFPTLLKILLNFIHIFIWNLIFLYIPCGNFYGAGQRQTRLSVSQFWRWL